MCRIAETGQIEKLLEVEELCSLAYKRIGISHNVSVVVPNDDKDSILSQCTADIFNAIQSQNPYFKIVQQYINMQHTKFICSSRTFVVLLGCTLHYLIPLFEQSGSNRRFLIQGIQEAFELLGSMYRKGARKLELSSTELSLRSLGRETTDFLKNQINRFINSGVKVDYKEDMIGYLHFVVERLCHYDDVNLKELLWKLLQDLLLTEDLNVESNISVSNFQALNPLSGSNITVNSAEPMAPTPVAVGPTLSKLGTLISQKLMSNETGVTGRRRLLEAFKEGLDNVTVSVTTDPSTAQAAQQSQSELDATKEELSSHFLLRYGLLVAVMDDTAAVLAPNSGLRNCLLMDGDLENHIFDIPCNASDSMMTMLTQTSAHSASSRNFRHVILDKLTTAHVNCVLMSGTCESNLRSNLQTNLRLAILERVSPKILTIIGSLMDTRVHDDVQSSFTTCQLLVSLQNTKKIGQKIYCTIQIPQWMKLFGVVSSNLKTVIIRHFNLKMAEALHESFLHNLHRIKNTVMFGYFLDGSGILEKKFASDLRTRANDKLLGASRQALFLEERSSGILAIANALDLFHYHLTTNIESVVESSDKTTVRLDDLMSKLGCIDLLSQCLTNLFSVTLMLDADSTDTQHNPSV